MPPPLRWSAQRRHHAVHAKVGRWTTVTATHAIVPSSGRSAKGSRAPAIGRVGFRWVHLLIMDGPDVVGIRPSAMRQFLVGLAILLLSAAAVAIFIAGEVGVAPTNPQERPGLVPAPTSSRGSRFALCFVLLSARVGNVVSIHQLAFPSSDRSIPMGFCPCDRSAIGGAERLVNRHQSSRPSAPTDAGSCNSSSRCMPRMTW